MRTAFIDQLQIEARKNDRIFLLVGDLGFSVVEPFAEAFPDRFLNVGIAEQNMTGIAAGLAMQGYSVFTYSIANFPTLRCMEQIRYDVCYHNLDVKVVAVGAGYAYAALGPSHHATEDIGMLRTLPGLTLASPGDPQEARLLTTYLCQNPGPAYVRLGKAGEAPVHPGTIEIKKGHPVCVKEGKGTAVLATGSILRFALDEIQTRFPDWALYSFPILKPLDRMALLPLFEGFDNLISLEEHQLSAGFGSALLEAANDLRETRALTKMPMIRRIGIRDEFISIAGSQEYIRQKAGLVL
jgi:transketolase